MSYGVGGRRGLDLALLWLWCRPAVVALIRPLAWEIPHATHMAPKKKKKKFWIPIQLCQVQAVQPQVSHLALLSPIFLIPKDKG